MIYKCIVFFCSLFLLLVVVSIYYFIYVATCQKIMLTISPDLIFILLFYSSLFFCYFAVCQNFGTHWPNLRPIDTTGRESRVSRQTDLDALIKTMTVRETLMQQIIANDTDRDCKDTNVISSIFRWRTAYKITPYFCFPRSPFPGVCVMDSDFRL